MVLSRFSRVPMVLSTFSRVPMVPSQPLSVPLVLVRLEVVVNENFYFCGVPMVLSRLSMNRRGCHKLRLQRAKLANDG